MRIISGAFKGRRINAPNNLPVRPTTDMAKEGLFNILNHRILWETTSAIDLFAGTGNISFELASRGVQNIIAVDQNIGCYRFIKKMSSDLEAPIRVQKGEVFLWLKKNKGIKANLVFADPPYHLPKKDWEALIPSVFDSIDMGKYGFFVLEHPSEMSMEALPFYTESRKYGGSSFSFFQRN